MSMLRRQLRPQQAFAAKLHQCRFSSSANNSFEDSAKSAAVRFFRSSNFSSGQKGAETTVPAEPERVFKDPVIDDKGRSYGTGRRKTSVARVWIKEGNGQFIVNKKNIWDYFQPMQREHALQPFLFSKTAGLFDVVSTVKGGGISGQAGAVRLGVARALDNYIPTLRPILKKEDLLTRDSRRVERKKPGQKKARKKFQWVKR